MNATKDLLFVAFVIVILWIVWFFTGGPTSERAQGGPFLRPPAPLGTGETYGELPGFLPEGERRVDLSISSATLRVDISGAEGARADNPADEYIRLRAHPANTAPVVISDWQLRGSDGRFVTLGRGASPFEMGAINERTQIRLAPGQEAIVLSGYSPVGVSFEENVCTGYLEQFQNFTPPLARSCPSPAQELGVLSSDAACVAYVGTIPSCEMVLSSFPAGLSQSCVQFVQREATYNTCVVRNQHRTGFENGPWRIYLNQNTELWQNGGGTIRLYDAAGELADSLSY